MRPIDTAHNAANAAAKVLMKYFTTGTSMRAKRGDEVPYDLVSDADLEAERTIAAVIRESFPDHTILGEEEESGSIDAEHLWIIDPLDGTNNFAHALPNFASSIAYYEQGQPICGVVDAPALNERFEAERDGGARRNAEIIHCGRQTRLDQVLIGCGFYYDRGDMMRATLATVESLFGQNIHGIRRIGSAALDICHVAAGRFGAFFEYQLSPWDFAAARLILEEAGGQVTDCAGDSLPLAKTSLLASNGHLHQTMVALTTPGQRSVAVPDHAN
ncbi:inositol monophosphatase family protein [Stratiformator vulcanicus]|uniref:Inositol-1-monophosphatase n=1 Tax=Stratiformator vulcanicus TaxID=2527980 RepID=A0A517QYI5_9PLAN|nr:inositol monophosphatase family protein [Stratiformator vulcanicus]QDT36610.1 Inositol-1-monophosphatase [Stratiformator vulcanicus]